MNVLSLKDYAEQRNVTYEAVRKQVARYKNELEGHIIMDGRQQFLDDEAVAFLDAKRKKNPVVLYQQNKDEQIRALEEENKNLLIEVAALAKWKADNAVAIAEVNQTRQLLEDKSKEVGILEGFLRDAKNEIQELGNEKDREKEKEIERVRKEAADAIEAAQKAVIKEMEDKIHLVEQNANQLREKLEEVEKLPFWKKMFWHR